MRAIGEEALKACFRFGHGVGPRDADGVEAMRARLRDDLRFELRPV